MKLDLNGNIIQTIPVPGLPLHPIFDGTNIWVPYIESNSIIVVRASTGAVLATLTGNGLSGPDSTAFDGERILVVNNRGQSVSLWKATDLTPIGSFSTGVNTAPAAPVVMVLTFGSFLMVQISWRASEARAGKQAVQNLSFDRSAQ